jgi:hypothetical protein
MLSQKFQRKDAETQRHKENFYRKLKGFKFSFFTFVSLRLCVFALFLIPSACKPQPTDLRAFAPSETLIYLESNDLANTLDALTENETFKRLSTNKKDFSALENVKIAVAVTGFESTENAADGGQATLNFKPRFVAVAEADLWNWQALALAENQIGAFVNEIYGGEVDLQISGRYGGRWFEWTSKDNRKAFALVADSRIFFGNDETAIEKCIAAGKGEIENLLKNENFTRAYDSNGENLAFGYVSTDGVAQIANIAAVSAAIETSDADAPRSFIARVLPEITRKSITEIVWTTRKIENGIEDEFRISTTPEISSVLKETIVPAPEIRADSAEFLPSDVFSATRYNLENPQAAWRTLLLAMAKQTNAASAKILIVFADGVFAPYGIAEGELFLSAVGSEIITARFDADGEKSAVIVTVKNLEAAKKSLTEEINLKNAPENQSGAEIWKSEDSSLSAAFTGDKLILGDSESVLKCLTAKRSGQNFTKTGHFPKFSQSDAAAVTFSGDLTSAESVVKILGDLKTGQNAFSTYLTETRFRNNKFERKTVSAFGFIGTIIEQFENEN